MSAETAGWKRFFLFAALFNFAAGLSLLLAPALFLQILTVEAPLLPQTTAWIHQFAGLVLVFGGGYWVVSLDPPRHRDIIWMGCIGKIVVFALAWIDVWLIDAPLGFAILVIADLLFAMIFAVYLAARR